MKKILFITVAAMITSLAFAQKIQEKNVPKLVKTAFQTQYPNAKEVKWDKEGEKFEASFDLSNKDNSVLFDAKGNVLETEREIGIYQLPENIRDYVAKNYPNQKIKEAAMITDNKGVVTFEAEVKGMALIFDGSGKFIKSQKD